MAQCRKRRSKPCVRGQSTRGKIARTSQESQPAAWAVARLESDCRISRLAGHDGQRWGKSGMPVRREGRFTVADADELREWLGRESDMPAPAHIATNSADLTAGLRQSISELRRRKHAS